MAAPKALSSKLDDYDLQYIDKGAFGSVFKAVRRTDGRVFALKQVDLSRIKERVERAMAVDEARMLAQLTHPHVVRYYDSFIDSENRLNILMEFAAKGNLRTLLKSYKGKPMPEDAVWRVLVQSLLGLGYLHSKKIIHRDIKSANLFIDSSNNIKIGDLGIARALSATSNFAHTRLGTPYYLAPELCEDKPYNTKTDIWALGIVMYECCMGCYPFDVENNNEAALIRKIMRGQFRPVQGPYSPALIQLVTSCLTFKPENRPDTMLLLRNPALQAKAKALNIDLNPRAPAQEDRPVYESPTPAGPPAVSPQPLAGPSGHPFASPGGYASPQPHQYEQQRPHQNYIDPQNPYDRLAVDVNKMQLRESDLARINAERIQQAQANIHAGKQDHAKGVIYGGPQDSGPKQQRLSPEALPAAGKRPTSAHAGAPFATHYNVGVGFQSQAQESMNEAWRATYQPPQYGRRRNPELQITGPSLRSTGARGGGGGGGRAGFVPAADDATTYVSSTTYYTQR
ncbi:hypothetical protein GPECTOR_214g438 [Gonium pectorale]|uniref:non-specific serine/threonine protein kinase n=1 Tax=Gonium pectorale TaxID=33097 RepID=A0A150FWS7_GONPE|nr:hypothetical protein GPECTOR_214g438 [Gonium pectorale]|eukprot:KXZ42056.1 hypothetical protein GPECTOR_214g438 [Gonium pectorale]